jgi:hypothetical protein
MAPGRRDIFWAESTGPVAAPGVAVQDAPVCQMEGCAQNVYQSAWLIDLIIAAETSYTVAFDPVWDVTATPVLNVRVGVPTHGSVTALGPPEMQVTFVGTDAITVTVDDPAVFMPPSLPVDGAVGAAGLASVGGSKVSANAVSLPVPEELRSDLEEVTFTFSGPAAVDQVYLADAWFNPERFAPRPATAPS